MFLMGGFKALGGVSSCRAENVNVGGKKNPWSSFPWFLCLLSCPSLLRELLVEVVACRLGGGSSKGRNWSYTHAHTHAHCTHTPLSGRRRSPPSVTAIQPFLERDTESNILKVGD